MKGCSTIGVAYFMMSLVLSACTDRDKHGRVLDTPTAGNITITVDESLRPIVEAVVSAFEGIYQQAHVQVKYMSEVDAIDALLKDSVRLSIVTRRLEEGETALVLQDKIVPTEIDIATGAVALIINPANPDSLLTKNQLKEILEGKITDWKQINPRKISAPIEVIFDNPASGIVKFLKDSVVNFAKLPSNCFAVNNNQKVVEYVSKNPRALGLIGVEWISDHDDSIAHDFLKSIRVISLSRDSEYFKPAQAYIALHQYPLCRSVVMISREARAGLASGFMAFVAGDKGQRIVLKAGLVPATMPVRIVEINQTGN